MQPDEIFITVRPSKMAEVVTKILEDSGFKRSGAGNMMTEDGLGQRDLWFKVPEGMHPDEFKFVPTPK